MAARRLDAVKYVQLPSEDEPAEYTRDQVDMSDSNSSPDKDAQGGEPGVNTRYVDDVQAQNTTERVSVTEEDVYIPGLHCFYRGD